MTLYIKTICELKKLIRKTQGRLRFQRGKEPYWKGNRWHWNAANTTLEGRFRTPYCAPKGRLEKHPDGTFTFYIYDPPEKLFTHPKKKYCFCLTQRKKGEYQINFTAPKKSLNIDGCILEVERTLVEAFEHRS